MWRVGRLWVRLLLLFEFPKDLQGVGHVEHWVEHLQVLGAGSSGVLAVELIHLDLGFTMLGVNLKDAVVGNDGFAGLIAFFVKDSQVVPDLTAVWLDVLRL